MMVFIIYFYYFFFFFFFFLSFFLSLSFSFFFYSGKNHVTVSLPKKYGKGVQNALQADASIVSFKSGPYYYDGYYYYYYLFSFFLSSSFLYPFKIM